MPLFLSPPHLDMYWIKDFELLTLWINISWMKIQRQYLLRCLQKTPFLEFRGCSSILRYVRDAKVEILSLRLNFLSKDKMIADANAQIQKLNTSVTVLQDKQTSLENEAEQAAVDGVFDVEQNILDQIKLRAHNLDISKVDAFKKVVDGKVISIV
ncbi:hypothetical protein AHAS_Ahas06G0002300 [Arachis hypogaea]